jgi:hypothetical protein
MSNLGLHLVLITALTGSMFMLKPVNSSRQEQLKAFDEERILRTNFRTSVPVFERDDYIQEQKQCTYYHPWQAVERRTKNMDLRWALKVCRRFCILQENASVAVWMRAGSEFGGCLHRTKACAL